MRALVWIALGSMVSAPALAGTWTNLWRTPDQQGQALLAAGKAAQAAQRFTDPRLKAYADLKAGQYNEAARLLAPFKDATSEYNRGNALARSGQLQAALAAYDAALKQDPNDRDIRHNRDLVARLLQQHSPQNSHKQAPGGEQSASGQTAGGRQSSDHSRNGKGHQGTGQPSTNGKGASQGNGSRNTRSGGGQSGKSGAQGQSQRADQAKGQGSGHDRGAGDRSSGAATSSSKPGDQGGGANTSPNGQAQSTSQPAAGGSAPKQSPGQARRDATWAAALARRQGQAGHRSTGAAASGEATKGSLRPDQAGQDFGVPGGNATPKPKPVSEKTLALDQWLRQIPDNPAGLLRRKFMIEYMMRHPGENPPGGNP